MSQHSDSSVVDHIGDSTAAAEKSRKGPCICVNCKCKQTEKQLSDNDKEVAENHVAETTKE